MHRSVLPAALTLSCLASAPLASAAPISFKSQITATHLENSTHFLLKPQTSAGPERLLVILTGVHKPAAEYLELAERIQATSPFRLWVSLPKFAFDTANPLELDGRMGQILADIRASGTNLSSQEIFLAGHSMGGIFAQEYAKEKGFAGLILLASYITRSSDGQSGLAGYPIPTLTLGGEIDGQTRLTRLAKDMEYSAALLAHQGAATTVRTKPTVILGHVNHSQFAGRVQMSSDLYPELDYDDAQMRIAGVVSDFLTLKTLPADSDPAIAAETRLTNAMSESATLVAGFLKLRASEEKWCATAQGHIAGPSAPLLRVEEVKKGDAFSFVQSKPILEKSEDGILKITVTSFRKIADDPFDIASNFQTARETSCKMKNRDAIETAQSLPVGGTATPCADLNALAYNTALQTLNPEARTRFLTRGRPMSFASDKNFSAGIFWIPAALELTNDGNTLRVQSPALVTSTEGAERYAGMQYCKVLSPAQAMEWMLIDSFRS